MAQQSALIVVALCCIAVIAVASPIWETALYSFTADCEGKFQKPGPKNLQNLLRCTHGSSELCGVYGVNGQDAKIYWVEQPTRKPLFYGTIPSGEFPKWLQSESIMQGKVKDFIQKTFCDGRGQEASVKAARKGFQVRPVGAIVPPSAASEGDEGKAGHGGKDGGGGKDGKGMIFYVVIGLVGAVLGGALLFFLMKQKSESREVQGSELTTRMA